MKLNYQSGEKGFTLIEVLISLVILSIGLLGMASMQLNSLQTSREAYLRSQASILAYDVFERMRSNAAELNAYEIGIGDFPAAVTNCQGSAANCAPASIVGFDVAQWKCSIGAWNDNSTCNTTLGVQGDLPEGDGSIAIDGDTVTVTISYENQLGQTKNLQVVSEF